VRARIAVSEMVEALVMVHDMPGQQAVFVAPRLSPGSGLDRAIGNEPDLSIVSS